MEGIPDWLHWARRIQAIAQNGLTYADSQFDRDRYQQLQQLAVEILAAHTGEAPATIDAWTRIQPGYATPKVDVRAACFRDGRILMVRERSDERWCLPGGWADVGDGPAEAAEREVAEESGFTAKARKVIAVRDCNRTGGTPPLALVHAFKVTFLCDITGGEASPDHEILEVGFFARHEIPPLSRNRTNEALLDECFRHLDEPGRPTAFD
ncbi:MAG: NUDIX hydrolase N-terminal domain-containing protein [Alphaproteobacteria bacterium]|nr:NUDIX hydrolase N-terminal domain-containing protein [Alphaproteobacteria bacterium]